MNRTKLEARVTKAAEETYFEQNYVSLIDVLLRIGYLQISPLKQWRLGRVPSLESCIQANPSNLSFVMKSFRNWAGEKMLRSLEITYSRPSRGTTKPLQYSKSGNAEIEREYSKHYISGELSAQQTRQLEKKLSKPPTPTIFLIAKESSCVNCGTTIPKGRWLTMDGDQPLCAACGGFDHLLFLPSGNPSLTRKAKKYSKLTAAVVKYSRSRKRYEQWGWLVEEDGLQKAKHELNIEEDTIG